MTKYTITVVDKFMGEILVPWEYYIHEENQPSRNSIRALSEADAVFWRELANSATEEQIDAARKAAVEAHDKRNDNAA